MTSTGRLAGRRALVTGGGRGIGRAIALCFAHEGADVAVTARSEIEIGRVAGQISSLGRSSVALSADVTRPEEVERMTRNAVSALGGIDILVNAAGDAESAPVQKTDWDLWRRMLGVNADGVFLCTRALIPAMIEAGWGRIINVASRAGLVGFAYVSAYCAAKHAVVGFTRAAALDLQGRGVTINALCPGYVDTAMTRRSAEQVARKTGVSNEDAMSQLASFNEDGRMIQPETVAEAALEMALAEGETMNGQAVTL